MKSCTQMKYVYIFLTLYYNILHLHNNNHMISAFIPYFQISGHSLTLGRGYATTSVKSRFRSMRGGHITG